MLENNERTIKNGQYRETGNIGYTRRRKIKQKHSTIYVGYHYTKTNRNNVNKTWAILQTTGAKDERISQHGTQTVKTHNSTTETIKKVSNIYPFKNRGWTQVLAKGKHFMPLIGDF